MERGWTEQEIKEMRARLAAGKRQGIWLSALEATMFLGLLGWWQRSSSTGWRRLNQGRAETVAEARARGILKIRVFCLSGCNALGRTVAIADLYMPPGRRPLPDHAAFLDIPNLCRFRCMTCGSRRVRMMPDWPGDKLINGDRE